VTISPAGWLKGWPASIPARVQLYPARILNISAMSFGTLSQNAQLTLNSGAKRGGSSHKPARGASAPSTSNTVEISSGRSVLPTALVAMREAIFSTTPFASRLH